MAEVVKKNGTERDEAPVVRRRFNLVRFFQEVVRETKKVTWPTWKETWLTSVMVFIMVALTMVFFFAVDTILYRGEMLLIGSWRPFG
jgi:preprotein translocase subunit SecE